MKSLFTFAFIAVCGTLSAAPTCIEQFNSDWVNAGEQYIGDRESCMNTPVVYAERCNWEAAVSLSHNTNTALDTYFDCIDRP